MADISFIYSTEYKNYILIFLDLFFMVCCGTVLDHWLHVICNADLRGFLCANEMLLGFSTNFVLLCFECHGTWYKFVDVFNSYFHRSRTLRRSRRKTRECFSHRNPLNILEFLPVFNRLPMSNVLSQSVSVCCFSLSNLSSSRTARGSNPYVYQRLSILSKGLW